MTAFIKKAGAPQSQSSSDRFNEALKILLSKFPQTEWQTQLLDRKRRDFFFLAW